MEEPFIASLSTAGFIVFWIALGHIIARFSGWGALAQKYSGWQRPTKKQYLMRSMRIGWSRYSNCVRFSIGVQGLHISLFPLFITGHHPILMPWREVHFIEREAVFSFSSKVRIGSGSHFKEITVPTAVIDDARSLGYLTP